VSSPEPLPKASLAESLRFVSAGLVPAVVRGLFKPRRGASKVLTQADADRRGAEALAAIRRKHGGQGARLLGGRMVTLWGVDALREVLDRSAVDFGSDAGAKAKGMAHFQPDALTVSRGEEWRNRRAFNEYVLATSERVHPDAERFLSVVADEVGALSVGDELTWPDFERLFDKITLRVVFGDRARDEEELTGLLEKLMEEANWIVGLGSDGEFHDFYGLLERQLLDPEPGSLVARIADAPQTDRTRVVHQIPHWMFATRDTLGANTYRALATVVGLGPVLERVREEMSGRDLSSPADVDGMRYLEGCLEEAMRLWPSTPLIARETTRSTSLVGCPLDEGTQVMILNVFNHRDAEQIPDAHRLRPERWMDGERDYRFNHLSNGSQDCPGGALVLLLGKAVLARMLERFSLRLEEPALDADADLPYMLDFFSVRFGVSPGAASRADS
jgi:cytochrome P450